VRASKKSPDPGKRGATHRPPFESGAQAVTSPSTLVLVRTHWPAGDMGGRSPATTTRNPEGALMPKKLETTPERVPRGV
jgi:hypothetical protein